MNSTVVRRVASSLALAAICLVAGCLKLDSFLFAPTRVDEYLRPENTNANWHVGFIIPESLYQQVVLTSSGGKQIYGYLVQPPEDARDSVTVLYCHGNGENIDRYWGRVEMLWQMGYRVFVFDYQGYGRSEGTPAGDACLADGRAALEYVLSRPEVNPHRIVYYGWSMGTFIATYLAADSIRPFGLVLESPPASAGALVKEGTAVDVPGSFVTDLDFNNEERITRVGLPVLMMHGRKDDYVPYARHGLRVIRAAYNRTPLSVIIVDDAGHDDVPYKLGDRYADIVTAYVSDRAAAP
jgi:pimeloyl-ACP methyl ester carboxylesterase